MINFRIKITPSLKNYIEHNIISCYKKFDEAHQESHAQEVINNALYLSSFYDIKPDIVYTAAAYHDIGLGKGRENHQIESGRIVRNDKNLLTWFTEDEIESIAKAAEDHRSSNNQEPRELLGKIISEADRIIDCDRTLERTLRFGISNYPTDNKEQQIQRAITYITEKYGPSGRIKIWIPESPNKKQLRLLQDLIKNKNKFYNKLSEIYDLIIKN